MKKLCFLLIFCFFISLITTFFAYGENEIKKLDNLMIYVKNQEYEKKNVFLKEGVLYTSLGSLAKSLSLSYEYDMGEEKLYVNGMEYDGNYYAKGQYVYVPFQEMCEYLGYYVDYNESTNTLDVSGKPIQDPPPVTYNNGSQIPSSNSGTSTGKSGTIVPGSGIQGVAYLGDSFNSVKASWGSPDGAMNMAVEKCDKIYFYSSLGIGVGVDTANRVTYLGSNSPSYSTVEGLAVGSTFQQVEATYGKQYLIVPDKTGSGITEIIYTNGLSFAYDNQTNIVQAIGVYLL